MKLKKSSLVTKLIILIPVVAATVTLVSLQGEITEKRQKAQDLQAKITAVEQENQRLTDAISEAGSEDGIKALARNKLGMVEPGEIVFYDLGG